jgi:hypothetical protein
MVPNMGLKWKQKKDAVNTFKVATTGRLVTFTTEIFGIPLMKQTWHALKHCLEDVKEDKRACYTMHKRGCHICHVYQRHPGISVQMQQDKDGVPTWADHILPLHQQNDPLKNYCCLFTHRCNKKVHLEKPVINPLFVGIVSFRGNDRIMSVSRGGEPDFEEFNLSSLYQMSQD